MKMEEAGEYPYPEFLEAVQHDDDLAAVVRTHLYVELRLNELIEKLLPYPEDFEVGKLNWPTRVELSIALGLSPQYGQPLRKIGSIRNRFAHQAGAVVEEKDSNDLYTCLSEGDKEIVLESFKQTNKQMDQPLEKEFLALSARDRFTLIAIAMHSMLVAAVSEAHGKQ